MWLLRGKAVSAFATLETTLCQVFGSAGKLSQKAAEAIFFEFLSMPSRLGVLRKLLVLNHGDIYLPFWDSVQTQVGGLNTQRNKVVHWHEVGEGGKAEVFLAQPVFSDFVAKPSRFTTTAVKNFIRSADFVSERLAVFNVVLQIEQRKIPAGWMPNIEACKRPIQLPSTEKEWQQLKK